MNTTNLARNTKTIVSLEVAEMIGKDHSKLIRDIRRYISQLNEAKIGSVDFFHESSYVDAKGENRICYNITRKGCDFIANKLTGQKGTEFTARYVNRFYELEENIITDTLLGTLTTISQSMLEMRKDIDARLSKLEESQAKKQLPQRKYSRWKTNTFNKLNALLSFVNENSQEPLKLSEIIHLVIGETEDSYAIEMADYVDAYKSEYGLEENPYVMDVIHHYRDVRDMFTCTIDSILAKLHIPINDEDKYSKSIFDELAFRLDSGKKRIDK